MRNPFLPKSDEEKKFQIETIIDVLNLCPQCLEKMYPYDDSGHSFFCPDHPGLILSKG